MHMITMRLVPLSAASLAPDQPSEPFLAQCTSADRVEHIWAQNRPDRIDLVFFVISEHEAEALLCARAVCERALSSDRRLVAWRLADERPPAQ
ncbi:hypothetical protein ACWCYL_43815 [Streptomyces sp. 900105755]